MAGFFNILIALCYAELGTAFPQAGGDYAYTLAVLGPLPAYLSSWLYIVMLVPIVGAFISNTVGLYGATLIGMTDGVLVLILALLIIGRYIPFCQKRREYTD